MHPLQRSVPPDIRPVTGDVSIVPRVQSSVRIVYVTVPAGIRIVTAPAEAAVTAIAQAALRAPFSAPTANVIHRVDHQKPTALQVPAAMVNVSHVPPEKYWERIVYVTLPAGVAGTVKWVRAVWMENACPAAMGIT